MVAFAVLVEMKLLAVHCNICGRVSIKPMQTIAYLSCLSGSVCAHIFSSLVNKLAMVVSRK